MVKNMDFEDTFPGSESWLCHFMAENLGQDT